MKKLFLLALFVTFTVNAHTSMISRAVDVLVEAKTKGAWILPNSGRTLKAPSSAQMEVSYMRFHRFVTKYFEDGDRSWSAAHLSRQTPEVHEKIYRTNRVWGTAGLSFSRDYTVHFSLLSAHKMEAHELEEITAILTQRLDDSGKKYVLKMDPKTQKFTLDVNLLKITEKQLRSLSNVFTDFKDKDVALGF